MLIYWIWLAEHPDLTDRQKQLLLTRFSHAEDIFFADAALLADFDPEIVKAVSNKDLTEPEKILRKCNQKGIEIITFADEAYPNRLKNITDPPLVLYYKGILPDFDNLPLIAVVGTRRATPYGLTTAKRMGYQIASCGGVVVSGIATGIDAMAMQGALSAGRCVIAVLGCGVDVVYPASNRSLYADTERYGCLLSEFAPGTEPYKWNFPKRNRIISGLCCGVLVIEAPERSGALNTARHAAEQGRDVFVVPGNIDMPSCAGSNALLRDGAIMAGSGWDVMSEYEAQYPNQIQNRCKPGHQMVYPDEMERLTEKQEAPLPKVAQKASIFGRGKEKKKKEIDTAQSSHYIDAEVKRPPMTAQEETILSLVQQGRTLVDDIIAESNMPAGAVLAVLTMLEVKGVLKRLPGKRVELK